MFRLAFFWCLSLALFWSRVLIGVFLVFEFGVFICVVIMLAFFSCLSLAFFSELCFRWHSLCATVCFLLGGFVIVSIVYFGVGIRYPFGVRHTV